MPRKHFRKYLPSYATVCENPYLSRYARFLQHPNLWHLNRRSVAGGVALGLFAGLIPGPVQMLGAALLAVPMKVNLPVAMATTWYTNPLTIGPLYLLAYEIGKWLTGEGGVANPAPDWDFSSLALSANDFVHWMLSLGKPLGLGLIALALGLAVLGWFSVWFGWRWYVVSAWRRRAKRRLELRG